MTTGKKHTPGHVPHPHHRQTDAPLQPADCAALDIATRFRLITETIEDIFWLSTPGVTRMIYVSPAYEKIWGRSCASLYEAPQSFIDAIHPEDRERVRAGLAEHARGHWEHEYRVVHPGGEVRWVRDRGFPIHDAQGGLSCLTGIVTDITRHKQAEEALQKSEELFHSISQSARDAILMMDDQGIITYWNPAAQRIFGHADHDVVGRPLHDIIAPAHYRQAARNGLELFASDGNGRLVDRVTEFEAVHKDGHEFPVELSISAFQRHGRWCAVGVLRDITDRRRAESELRRSETSLAEAQRIAHLGNWDWNIVNNSLRWSDEIYRIFGLEPQQFAATYDAFLERVHPDDRAAVTAAVNTALRERAPYRIDHRIVCPDGNQRIVQEQGEVIVDADGTPVRMIGTVQDITDIKRTEQDLRRANRALHTLSRCNEILVHAENEDGLLKDICHTLIEAGGYRMAWVGYAEQDADRTVRPVSWSGDETGYVEHAQVCWSDNERGRGPVGRAIRENTTVIVRNVETDPDFRPWRDAALKRGYHSVIALPLRMGARTFGSLGIYSAEPDSFDAEEVRLLEEMAADLSFGIRALRTQAEHAKAAERERKLLLETIGAMALTIEKRDPYTAGHQTRVAQLATAIARELGYDEHRIEGLRLAAMVHDIGKIYVPAEILNRPGRLTLPEFEVIKTHVEVGYDILKTIDFPWPVADIVHQHHERLDGTGYPQGIRQDAILPEARILAVADVVESIHSHRPYRPALGMDIALKELEDHMGTRYDAEVVEACLRLFREGRFSF